MAHIAADASAPRSPRGAAVPNWHWLAVGCACLVALGFRTVPRFWAVFQETGVRFQGRDAYYHLRYIEHLLHNFPHRMSWDPYGALPAGQPVGTSPFFDYLLASIIWVAGGGSPSQSLMHSVAAWFPAVAGALIPIPVYLLGRLLFSGAAALFAAALVAVMQGHFLWVSTLGFADHHVLESLLSTLVMLFLILALRQQDRPWSSRAWSICFGVALACYLAAWVGGSFLVAILVAWGLLACIHRHWRGETTGPILRALLPGLCVSLLLFLPVYGLDLSGYTVAALGGGILALVLAGRLSKSRSADNQPRLVQPALFVLAVLLICSPFSLISEHAQTISENRPLLHASLTQTAEEIWGQFHVPGILAGVALVQLLLGKRFQISLPVGLFLLWTVVMLAASLLCMRICYYSAINVSLLGGYLCSSAIGRTGGRKRALATGTVLLAALAPNLRAAQTLYSYDNGPSQDWSKALAFLRTSTPEPFGSADFFDHRYTSSAQEFDYPDSAYAVMNDWADGNWVLYLGRRIPVGSNIERGGAREAADFYLSGEEQTAGPVMQRSKARYVLTDSDMPVMAATTDGGFILTGTMVSMAVRKEESLSRWAEVVWRTVVDGIEEPIVIYYPDYFRSMAIRLFVYEGREVTPHNSTWLIRLEGEAGAAEGRRLVWSRLFPNYQEAVSYKEQTQDPELRIASLHPYASCIPLAALSHFQLEYASSETAAQARPQGVKVFSYTP